MPAHCAVLCHACALLCHAFALCCAMPLHCAVPCLCTMHWAVPCLCTVHWAVPCLCHSLHASPHASPPEHLVVLGFRIALGCVGGSFLPAISKPTLTMTVLVHALPSPPDPPIPRSSACQPPMYWLVGVCTSALLQLCPQIGGSSYAPAMPQLCLDRGLWASAFPACIVWLYPDVPSSRRSSLMITYVGDLMSSQVNSFLNDLGLGSRSGWH